MSQPSFFRPDIEGLRAIAVLLVVACHAGVPWLQGGYVGVDVFFVISGYLITRLLQTEYHREGQLNLSGFYARRVRRLLPALALMIAAVLVGIRVLHSPFEQPVMLQSVFATVLYISNLHFAWGATDYWGADAKQDPLLHTWSLGVEEQFYVVWPLLFLLLMFLLRKARPAVIWGSAGLLMLLSFGLSLAWTQTRQPEAFFFPFTRAWEFGAGAILALAEARLAVRVERPPLSLKGGWGLAVLGLSTVLLAAVAYDGKTVFPGVAALLPVLGTVTIIAAFSFSGGTGPKLLSVAPVQWLGRMSYGWYLWHWPLLVFGKMLWPETVVWRQLLLVLAALMLAAISYRLVETPIRQAPRFRVKGFALGLAVCIPVLFVVLVTQLERSANVLAKKPEYTRFLEIRGSAPAVYAAGCDHWFYDAVVVKCVGGAAEGGKTAVLLGDSHAGQWFSAFHSLLSEDGWRLVFITKSACPIVDESYFYEKIGRIYRECDAWRAAALAEIASMKPDLVIVAGSENYPFTPAQWHTGSMNAISFLARASRKVAILRDTPLPGIDAPACLARKAWQPDLYASSCTYRLDKALSSGLKEMHQAIAAEIENVEFIDMTPFICDRPVCGVVDGDVIKFRDGNHLSDKFVRRLAPDLGALLRKNGVM